MSEKTILPSRPQINAEKILRESVQSAGTGHTPKVSVIVPGYKVEGDFNRHVL